MKNGDPFYEAEQSVCGIITRIDPTIVLKFFGMDGEQGWGGNDENLEVL